MKVAIVNGPNLNLLGEREQNIYGSQSFDEYLAELREEFQEVEFTYFQSNVEGELIDALQGLSKSNQGIILNAGGYTHTSVALADCVAAIKTPVVEVHISNLYAREEVRHVSLTGRYAAGVITGFGLVSYRLALLFLLSGNNNKVRSL